MEITLVVLSRVRRPHYALKGNLSVTYLAPSEIGNAMNVSSVEYNKPTNMAVA